jgi:nucleotide-binding universal stress UspA family protein
MPSIGNRIDVSLNTILFATDFSPSAETAKLYLQALALRFHSQLVVLHVVDLSNAFKAPDAGISIDVFRRIGAESLSRTRTELTARKLEVETILCESIDPVAAILDVVEDKSMDLLVIGTRGHKGLARLVLGSTAELLIHRAKCPILVVGPGVPHPKEPMGLRRVVYATDFSPEAAKACVFALSFAQAFGAHLHLCHVLPKNDDPQTYEELNYRFVKALEKLIPDGAKEWCEPECVLDHGVAADGIRLLAQRVKADLIVLGTRAASSHWYDNFKDGVALQVISDSRCPVLTIRG